MKIPARTEDYSQQPYHRPRDSLRKQRQIAAQQHGHDEANVGQTQHDEVCPVARPLVFPVQPRRHDDGKNGNPTEIPRVLQHSAALETRRHGRAELVCLDSGVDMQHAPQDIEQSADSR